MKTTKTILTVWLLIILTPLMAQVKGNVSYITANANHQYQVRLPTTNINIPYQNASVIEVKVKGLANVRADYYVAIFNLTQAAQTASEVNKLIDERINHVKNAYGKSKDVSLYVDMLSFVPIYEMDVVKKLFSKTTYNEIPAGFEVQKNLHIRYKDPNLLNDIIAKCAESEIYNLVRVDLFSDSLELIKKELVKKARKMLDEKLKDKQSLLQVDLNNYSRSVVDGYRMVYPIEMYKSYQAYDNNSIKKSTSSLKRSPKATTYYYKPIFDTDFDFSINPVIFEPVIQVMYEIKLRLVQKPIKKKQATSKPKVVTKVQKEFILITPKGEVKQLKI